ncbi:uncharacterized protein YjcR [Sphingomonas kyeonggiensis]|uniref:DUF1804 family protein n=1 Tax=Sphingomonas kyeonggiensis TaxID=1268553 RepID=UPI0027808D3C|nr:uncharacterized protein YjcR [Sphingomonas kyeonggiensis]
MTGTIPFDARRRAKHLYWACHTLEQVAEVLDVSAATVRSWKARDAKAGADWDKASPLERMEGVTEAVYCAKVLKEHKNGSDYKEIDLLGRQAERFARVRRYEAPGGHEGDLNPNIEARNAGPKKRQRKNHLTAEQIAAVIDAFENDLFEYQLAWRGPRTKGELLASTTRFILKSRQIGATFYFAREAFIRLLETGNNQIFISASRAQANNFRQYIVDFVLSVTGVKLTGDPIVMDLDEVKGPLGESPKLYFLGTNYRTAQSYHGDVYVDECFWIYGFEQIDDVASGMASQARYRITYFSTPSTIAHEAYRAWSGERYNEDRPKSERADFKFSDEELRKGVLGADGVWRQRVTIVDAEAGGCDLFDVDRLKRRYAPDVFDNLFMCKFVDDSDSMFPFALMRRAMVDSWETWKKDFDPYALRPYGDREVWIGYDPAESAAGDDAALVIVAPPLVAGGKFRVLEKFRLKGRDFQEQAAKIIEQLDRYNVGYIGIDSTGAGASVWKLVKARFPLAKRIDYNVAVKTEMVLKAKNVFMAGRIEFDSGAQDIANSFMAIRAELTPSQRQVTYKASRAGDTGHADLAWAIMHVLHNEPLDPANLGKRKSRVRISGNGREEPGARGGRGREQQHRDRRDADGWRRRQGADLPLRRSGAGARSPGVPGVRRVLAERALVRATGADEGAGALLRHVAAPPQRHHLQAQPAAAPLRAAGPLRKSG